MFKDNLNDMINELSQYHTDKNALLKKYTQERLEMSLKQYYKEIEKSFSYLQTRSENSINKNYKRIFSND